MFAASQWRSFDENNRLLVDQTGSLAAYLVKHRLVRAGRHLAMLGEYEEAMENQ